MRYSAFISYSHVDRAWAAWLHRALETYRVPRRLRGRDGPFGPIGARLPPVFRDRDELRVSPDLGQALSEALAESETLIVVCSPHAAGSHWVNEEIRAFARLGRAARIFCLIVSNDPNLKGAAHLPPALLEDGRPEPLAADVRRGKDGREPAKLKLIAGILGLNYDDLRHREALRRQRQLAAVAAASLAGVLLTSALAAVALIARDEAVRERNLAEQRTMTAERTVDFVESLFDVSDPSEARGSTVTAREMLDRGAQQIQSGLDNEPAVKAQLGVTLGEVYESLGLYNEGDQLIRATLSLHHGQDDITALQLVALADSEEKLGNYDGAIATDRQVIDLATRSSVVGPDLKARALAQLAQAQSDNDDAAASAASARAALLLDQARQPPEAASVARDLEILGAAQMSQHDWAGAQATITQALALRRQDAGPLGPSVADDLNSLGNVAYGRGDLAAAENDFRQVMAIDAKVFAPDHPDVAVALNGLARVMIDRREFADALPLLRRAVAINVKQRSADSDDMAFVYMNLALAERGSGQDAAAQATFEKALTVAEAHKHQMLPMILSELGDMRCQRGAYAEGEALLAKAQPLMQADFATVPWRSAWLNNVLGECRLRSGDASGAALIRASSPVVLAQWPAATMYGHEAQRRLAMAQTRADAAR